MSVEVPEVGDRVRIVYTKHEHFGAYGVITGVDAYGEEISIRLDHGVPTVCGCEDYELVEEEDRRHKWHFS